MHNNRSRRREKEAIDYIHAMVDAYGGMAGWVKCMTLNCSRTGAYHQGVLDDPPPLEADYWRRYGQLFDHIFKVDTHQLFTSPAVGDLVRRIDPLYLTFEMISRNNEQLKAMLATQGAALAAGGLA